MSESLHDTECPAVNRAQEAVENGVKTFRLPALRICNIRSAITAAVTVTILTAGTAFLSSCTLKDKPSEEPVKIKELPVKGTDGQKEVKIEESKMSDAELKAYLEKYTTIRMGIKKGQDEDDKRERLIFQLNGEERSFVLKPGFKDKLKGIKDPQEMENAVHKRLQEITGVEPSEETSEDEYRSMDGEAVWDILMGLGN